MGTLRNMVTLVVAFTLIGETYGQVATSWDQWGGTDRDFNVEGVEFPAEFSIEENWRRDLGGGYSAILFEDDRLYTMYRGGDNEVVICLNSQTGETIWEKSYAAPLNEDADSGFGTGPNSTPIIVDDSIISIGFNGDLCCFEKSSGKQRWRTNLVKDHGGTAVNFGYSASPIYFGGNVILPVGGDNKAVMAFKVSDGSVAWSSQNFKNSYSTPLLTNVDGLDQMIFAMTDEVVSINPKNGELFWTFPLTNQWNTHAFVPVWDKDNNVLFVSSFRQSHALKMSRADDAIKFEKKWSIEKTGIGFTNAVQVGNVIYGTTGGQRSPLVTAISLEDGEIFWKERGFGVSNFLAVGDKLIILDEKGTLALAAPNDKELGVIGEQELFEATKGWTVPTMIGNTIYVRDQKQIGAFKLN